jgi:hypothetical protein
MTKKISIMLLLLAAGALSCEDRNPIDEEQYFKQVYIVGSHHTQIVTKFDIKYSATPQPAYISVAVGGSLNIDHDVSVTVAHDDNAIEWYNNKYMWNQPAQYQTLDASLYSMPSMTATIEAGKVYARLPFTVATEKLHCDSLYALAFEIASTSDFAIAPVDTVLILNFNLGNIYSGVYQLSAVKYTLRDSAVEGGGVEWLEGAPMAINTSRTLKATGEKSVRFFNEAKAETREGYESNEEYFAAIDSAGVTFTLLEGSTFATGAWNPLALEVADAGQCTYANGTFTFWYDYIDKQARYRMRGTLKK